MGKSFIIKNGHNLILEGTPQKSINNIKPSKLIIYHPNSIKNIKTKLLVKENDLVKIGTPLFYDKKNIKALLVSTCSGKVEKINFGSKRVVESIIIKNDNKFDLEHLKRDVNRDSLLAS